MEGNGVRLLTEDSAAVQMARRGESSRKRPTRSLAEGKVLPSKFRGYVSKSSVCVPLEDLDPFYDDQQTFIVLTKTGRILRMNASRSLFLLSPINSVRRVAVHLLSHWLFSYFMVAVILLSCACLIPPQSFGIFFFVTEIIFVVICLFELGVKFTARGVFLGPFTAVRNIWTWLDITVIVLSLTNLGVQSMTLHGFMSIRILKIIPLLPDFLDGFELFSRTTLQLLPVSMYSILATFSMAIAALHLYAGSLTRKCIHTHNESTDSESWHDYAKDKANWLVDLGVYGHPYQLCGNASCAKKCPTDYTCQEGFGPNPDHGYASFDSFFWAYLNTFRLICQDHMDKLFQQIVETSGTWHLLAFIVVFVVGTWIIYCFTTAVVAKGFFDAEDEAQDSCSVMEVDSINGDNLEQTGSLRSFSSSTQSVSSAKQRCTERVDCIFGWNCTCCRRFRSVLSPIVSYAVVRYVVVIVIFLDIFFMALNYYGVDRNQNLNRQIHTAEIVCLSIYIIETILRFLSTSPIVFFRCGWNILDFFIAIVSVIYFCMETTTLRNILLIRILKLVPRWSFASWLLSIVKDSIKSFGSLFGLFLIYIFMFATSGVHFYRSFYSDRESGDDSQLQRWNFSNFCHGCLLVFRIVCGDWITLLWDCFRVANKSCSAYFYAAVVIGNLLVIFLCCAVAYTTYSTYKSMESYENDSSKLQLIFIHLTEWIGNRKGQKSAITVHGNKISPRKVSISTILDSEDEEKVSPSKQAAKKAKKKSKKKKEADSGRGTCCQCCCIPCKAVCNAYQEFVNGQYIKFFSSFLLFISCIALAIDSGIEGRSAMVLNTIQCVDIIFTVYFLLEVLLRLLANGPFQCLGSPGYIFDVLILVDMIVNLSLYYPYEMSFPSQGYLWIRCLRPIMLVSRCAPLQMITKGLLSQIIFFNDIIFVGLFVWLVFAIWGVYGFNGTFLKCVNSDGNLVPNITSRENCNGDGVSWENSQFNFDTVLNAFTSLAVTASFQGWNDIVKDAVDSQAHYVQPQKEANPLAYVYFIAFIVCGVFLTFSLLTGSVFYFISRKTYCRLFLTECQQTAQMRIVQKLNDNEEEADNANAPEMQPCLFCYKIVGSSLFSWILALFIMVDVVALALHSYDQSQTWTIVLFWIFVAITCVYTLEFVLKVCAWRMFYFFCPWNVLDSAILLFSIIGVAMPSSLSCAMAFRALRLFRLLNLKELVDSVKVLRCCKRAFLTARLTLFNFLLFYALILFTFTVYGMALFKRVKWTHGLDDVSSFQTFSSSINLIFRVVSFAGWGDIYLGLANILQCNKSESKNDSTILSDCGSPKQTKIFMFLLLSFSFLILLNVFLVFIMEIIWQLQSRSFGSDSISEELDDDSSSKDEPETAPLPYEEEGEAQEIVDEPLANEIADDESAPVDDAEEPPPTAEPEVEAEMIDTETNEEQIAQSVTPSTAINDIVPEEETVEPEDPPPNEEENAENNEENAETNKENES